MANKKDEVDSFYDLTVWQKAHDLALDIYEVTKEFPKDERFGLVNQMRRSSCSVTANIAEGFGRYHYKDKTKFYRQSRGSVMELQDQILLSKDLGFMSEQKSKKVFSQTQEIVKGLNGLVSSIEDQIDS